MGSPPALQITIERHAALDSTQARAAALLAAGQKPPFAVVAATQSKGRGRRGHSWQSPLGNLYVTLVLPPRSGNVSSLTWQPLAAAVAAARAIQSAADVAVTIKWPNDLLFAGAKLGGLICESTLAGQVPGPLLVGIGINVNAMPEFFDGDPQKLRVTPPTTLAAVRGAALDLTRFTDAFIAAFGREWPALTPELVAAEMASLAALDGQPWVAWDDALDVRRAMGLGETGELLLAPMRGGEPLRLTSVEHRYTWAYAATHRSQMPLVVADVGNSRVKLAYYRASTDPRPDSILQLAHAELAGEADALARAVADWRGKGLPESWMLFVLSVNAAAAAELQKAAARLGLSAALVRKRPVRVQLTGYPLAQLGADRLAAMEGALARAPGSRMPLLVVAAGTATTIDLIDASHAHRGGIIMPGLKTALDSLTQRTAALPSVPLPAEPREWPQLGMNTLDAMRAGALQMTLGAIERLRLHLQAESGGLSPRVMLTGGAAPVLSAHGVGELIPDLILDGARHMSLGGL